MILQREAFRKRRLVFVTKPKRRWLSRNDCVWAAPSALKQVIRLKGHYQDCEMLFCQGLGVKPADTAHVVNELCFGSDEDGWSTQRFKDPFSALGKYSSRLDQDHIERIRSAFVFSILEKDDDSRKQSGVAFCSIDNEDWYIPDRGILESSFRGEIDILSLPAISQDETPHSLPTSARDIHRGNEPSSSLRHSITTRLPPNPLLMGTFRHSIEVTSGATKARYRHRFERRPDPVPYLFQ